MRKDWSEILQACETRTGTLEEFAQSKGVSKAALSYQITQRNKSSKFIALAGIKEPVSFVEIEFPSGIKLRVQG